MLRRLLGLSLLTFKTAEHNKAMRSSKATIVLVPGAWHSPQHYTPLLHEFSKAGYTVVSQQLPSVNPAVPTSASVANDTNFIRQQLLIPLLEAGKEVLLITHSYGSVTGAAAAAGLSRQQRQAQGSEGGILGLVVIAGLLIGQGETLFNLFGGRFQPWHVVHEDTKLVTVLDPESVFYGDVQEAVASEAVAALLPHSKLAFTSECGMPAWAEPSYSGRSAYIRCSDDKAIPMAVQDSLLSASGVAWEVHTVASGRSPFLSCPADVAEYIVSFFNKIGASM